MRLRLLRLRFRRHLRQGQRQVGDLGTQAEQNLEQHFFKRYERLLPVRRFVVGWVALLLLLIGGLVAQNLLLSGYFQTIRPVRGGVYNEGMLGSFTNASPLFASGSVDSSVSRLIFAGLFTYNNDNQLTGDLAKDYSVDSHGTTYIVHLKPHLTWQDGRPLTSADIVFTYQTIQNPDTRSPLRSSWQGITVTAPDARTVVFKLPSQLAAFAYNLTNGIVPKHLLGNIPLVDLRSADFNTLHPVGAGAFAWQAINVKRGSPQHNQEQIALVPFTHYQGGEPKLNEFIVHAYTNQDELVEAFKAGQLNAVEGLTVVPQAIQNMTRLQARSLLMTAANMVFFKTSSGILADQHVRQALVQATDVPAIIKGLGYNTHAARAPFLEGQLGYDQALAQLGFDLKAAKATLDTSGWTVGKNGVRAKSGQTLSFTLTTANTPENEYVIKQLKRQWRKLGVQLKLQMQDSADFQNTLAYHSYDAVLHGISIGPDPDVFVYWHSSQADIRSANRLNLSEYKNGTADSALEAGRTRLNPAIRIVKYKPLLQAWRQDVPALGLYQPRLLYITKGNLFGLTEHSINTAADRFNNVHNWAIRQGKVTN